MLPIGLTGGIGSGKSTVCGMFARRGAVIIDADLLYAEVVQPGGPAYAPVVERFGPRVVAPDGALDRRALAQVVFADDAARADLNAITHPIVAARIAERLAGEAESDHVVVLAIPLLVEGPLDRYPLAGVIVVDAPVDLAVRRVVEGRGLAEDDVRARVAAQASREQRLAAADWVIDNSGTIAQLEVQVGRAWEWVQLLAGRSGR